MMKYLKILIVTIIFSGFINAQSKILPLSITSKESIKEGDYLKDINNDYKPFIGIWKANFEDKTIMVRILKVTKDSTNEGFGEDKVNYFRDILIMQHFIMDNQGKVLEDYFSTNLKIRRIESDRYSKLRKTANFFYHGVQCGAGAGGIDIKLTDEKHFIWNYTGICGVWGGCPKDADLTVYIPMERGLIFTKI